MKLSPEFALVVACCRWPVDDAHVEGVRSRAEGVDWAGVAQVAARHRVEALVWNALRKSDVRIAPAPASLLSAASRRIALQNVELTSLCAQLRKCFEGAGVEVVFLKGLTLAMLVHGTISLKAGWDIDVLVPKAEIDSAVAILREAGFEPVIPAGPVSAEEIARWHDVWKESVWRDARGRHVELHTRLVDNERLIPAIGMASPLREVALSGGISLPTFEERELFAYLCVHGASSGWFRLKWLADLAALLSGKDAAEVESLYTASQILGAGRAAAQGLLLAHHLFETPLTPGLLAALRSDAVNRWLLAGALRLLAGPGGAAELEAVRFGTLPIHLMQFGLKPGLGYKLSELYRQVVDPEVLMRRRLSPASAVLLSIFSRVAKAVSRESTH